VARYVGRHGTKRVAKAVLIGAIPPLMLKTANPGGLPIEVFDHPKINQNRKRE
jgi:non-heme chloroperoxidase